MRRRVRFPVYLRCFVVFGEAGEDGEEVQAGLGEGLFLRVS